MTLKKRLLAVSLSSIFALLAFNAQAKVLKVAEVQPAGYPTVVALEHMGEKLKQATDGRLEMKVYAGGVLGDEDQTLQQVQLGAIDMIRVSLAPVTTIAPETSVLTLPFIFRDEDHMHKVLDGSVGEQIVTKFNQDPNTRMVFLGWTDAGTRNMITKKPLAKPEDLQGMKIRVQNSAISLATLKAMGANPVAMGVSEVFSAMQTGVVDGTENNPPTFVAHNYLPVAKYYTLTGHFIQPEMILFSKTAWDRLSAEDQTLLKKLGKEAQDEERQLWATYTQQSIEKMKAGGVTFQQIDRDYFVKATQPVRDQFGGKYQDLMTQIAEVK
ncbi:TRAP transporter substrate-binding protein [Pantoea cypripedii]|uniref:C4-dicarboxylate ABC transporter n=1 Tax=Pantoea cypripedii TaxID=55209 RepID=A0A1X1EYC3_PANCY|nr:TRAP transporter substrate-binding protein [Pantoea cypripedii]MBP2195174.1 tripartite ATP-independent transporter DctP family solute receptor [Pantoea cypripedii]ORM95010.1 C4-dicarboxylate ABC transporter [Pantoea cypripedii]